MRRGPEPLEHLLYRSVCPFEKARLMILSCQTPFPFLPVPMKSRAVFFYLIWSVLPLFFFLFSGGWGLTSHSNFLDAIF